MDLLMRKNKTSLTAHHFMSTPSDSLFHSFSYSCLCHRGYHQNAPLCLPQPVFFATLWPETDNSVQSINLCLPQSGPVLCRATYGQKTLTQAHIPVSVTLNGINIWWWKEREKWRSTQSALCLPYTRLTSANETPPLLHLNTKSLTLQCS